MSNVNWFEIPVNDMDRAKEFYERSLNIEITVHEFGPALMGWFPNNNEQGTATGTLMKGDSYIPSHEGAMVYFSVDDIDATLERINQSGGKTLQSKMAIGEHGHIGVFEDSEGNRVALHSQS